MIPYSRPKLSDFYTLSQIKLLKNIPFTAAHTHIAYMWEYSWVSGLVHNAPKNQLLYWNPSIVQLKKFRL